MAFSATISTAGDTSPDPVRAKARTLSVGSRPSVANQFTTAAELRGAGPAQVPGSKHYRMLWTCARVAADMVQMAVVRLVKAHAPIRMICAWLSRDFRELVMGTHKERQGEVALHTRWTRADVRLARTQSELSLSATCPSWRASEMSGQLRTAVSCTRAVSGTSNSMRGC